MVLLLDLFTKRRNLTPDQYSLLRGRRYNRMKTKHDNEGGANDRTKGLSCQSDNLTRTAETLAQQHGVSARTIIRDGKRVEAPSFRFLFLTAR
jgi:hypothetical protein